MLRRNSQKVADKHIGDELHESFDHLRSAAAMAAEEAAARIAPAVESAKESMAPRIERAREAATEAWESRVKTAADSAQETAATMSRRARRKAEKASRKAEKAGHEAARRTRAAAEALRGEEPGRSRRWRWMLGALGAGAAIGAVAALISRRRTAEWEEYEGEPTEGGPTAVPSTETASPPAGKWNEPTTGATAGEATQSPRRTAGEGVEATRDKATTAKKRLAERQPEPGVPATTSRNDGTTGTGPRH